MNPRLMTLEQMEEREANRIAFQKAKAEKAIAKLSERALKADEKEAERLNVIIDNFKVYKNNLLKENVKTTALERFNKIQERIKPVKK